MDDVEVAEDAEEAVEAGRYPGDVPAAVLFFLPAAVSSTQLSKVVWRAGRLLYQREREREGEGERERERERDSQPGSLLPFTERRGASVCVCVCECVTAAERQIKKINTVPFSLL